MPSTTWVLLVDDRPHREPYWHRTLEIVGLVNLSEFLGEDNCIGKSVLVG